jgi:hypothetical protein
MGRTVLVITLLAAFSLAVVAQESNISLNARDNPQAVSAQPGRMQAPDTISSTSPFCPPKTCLYYAGDFDSTDSDANGLFNANDVSEGLEGLTWVGVKPPKAATVTGVTFNQFFTAGFVGTNPTPFHTQVGITNGNAGTIVCNTNGNATLKQYGESDFGLVQYSYTVKKLKQACKIAKPTKQYPSTYVNLAPTSSNGYGYVTNVEDAKPRNHRGWKNDLDDCYFECFECGAPPPQIYSACSSQGVFDEFSIALTGKEKK